MSENDTAEEETKTEVSDENAEIAPAGDETTSIETPPETPVEDQESAPAKDEGKSAKPGQTSRFIKKLSKRATTAENRADAAEKRIEDLEKRLGPTPEPIRPNRDGFDTDEEYEDALFDWRDEVKAEKPAPATTEVVTEVNPVITELEAELDAIAPDAALLVLEDKDGWDCSPEMTDYIMASDNRAQLAYHLATHPEISGNIAKMTPILAARELAKVEESIKGSSNATASVDTLPPPATHGSPSSVAITDGDKQSTNQWVADRRKYNEEHGRF